MKTRYKELDLERWGDEWRFIDASTRAAIGPCYRTKLEALADLHRFAVLFGCAE